jgi:hypothetical protein
LFNISGTILAVCIADKQIFIANEENNNFMVDVISTGDIFAGKTVDAGRLHAICRNA